ncbi:MAG: hypothetical protein EXS04_05115, partial [Phycisphaerales bacterium]|nr:hypothetical protein [Phycisphaerales bacterium]
MPFGLVADGSVAARNYLKDSCTAMLVTSIYLSCILGVAPPIDCNRNYVDDSIDISQGVSADSNIDGIPDECQDCTDCDGNGMPESIERAAASGLVGQYFSNDGNSGDFRTRVLTRIDSNINFNWNNGSPDPLVPVDAFSVRWTGTITAPTTGPCTFYTTTDDGTRLWIDGQLLVDKWISQSP